MKAIAIASFLVVSAALAAPTNETKTNSVAASSITNAPVISLLTVTNDTVFFNGKAIGRVTGGTNFVPVPNIQELSQTYENGFNVGVRYGATAVKRNPDVAEWDVLIRISKIMLDADVRKPQPQPAAQAK
jgi:hypothetical protein